MPSNTDNQDFMHGFAEYTDSELLEQAQFNAQALLMAGVLALGEDEEVLSTWIEGVGEVMTRGWDTDRDWTSAEVLDALLTNYRSYGAWIVESDFGDPHSAAIVADIPDVELAEGLGATDREADVLFRIGEEIARRLGRRMKWERHEESGDINIIVT